MVNGIKSLLEIDKNTARKFTVVHILENCVNNIKYSMLSTVLTAKTVLLIIENVASFDKLGNSGLQYVTQYPDGTSIRTLETKTQFLRRHFQFSVNEVFRMKAEHFSFKMKVLAI